MFSEWILLFSACPGQYSDATLRHFLSGFCFLLLFSACPGQYTAAPDVRSTHSSLWLWTGPARTAPASALLSAGKASMQTPCVCVCVCVCSCVCVYVCVCVCGHGFMTILFMCIYFLSVWCLERVRHSVCWSSNKAVRIM